MLIEFYRNLQEMFTWMDVAVISLILFITWFIYKVFISPKLSPLYKIPGERGALVLGIFSEYVTTPDTGELFLKKRERANNADIFKAYSFLGAGCVVIANREAYKYVTVLNNKNYPKPVEMYRAVINLIGNGLVTQNGEEHRLHRKLCMGAFKYSFLQSLVGKVSQHSSELVSVWNRHFDGNVNDPVNITITRDLGRAALDAIIHIGFDLRGAVLKDPDAVVSKAFESLIANIGIQHMFKLYQYLPTPGNLRFLKNKKLIDDLVNGMIEKKRAIIKESGDHLKVDNLLTMLLLAEDEESGVKLTSEQLHDHVLTFLFAGHETTATSLMWCLYTLAGHQEIQQKVREEIMSVVPSEDTPLTGDHLEKLTYQMCVIKETLRFHSIVACLSRKSLNDDHIGGYFIPKGTDILLSIGCIHMDPENWEEPEKFKPERFQDESKIKPFSFIPFTSGPRMCIGYKFAYLEMQVFLTHILRNFEFRLTPGMENVKKKYVITAKAHPPIVLSMTKVK